MRRTTIGILLALALILAMTAQTAWRRVTAGSPPQMGNPNLAVGIMFDDDKRTGQVIGVDDQTADVLARIKTADQPDVAVSPTHDRIFILETQWSADRKSPTHKLSAIDTNTWKAAATALVQDRILYPGPGPSGLVLSPDGKSLFIYHYKVLGDDKADYWLTAVDARTLRPRQFTLPVPDCGGAVFAATADRIVALCTGSNQLLFIDAQAGKISATVNLPYVAPRHIEGRAVDLVVSRDKQKIYVARNDMAIVEVAASGVGEPRMVKLGSESGAYAIGMSEDRSQLILATGKYGEPNVLHMIDPATMQVRDKVLVEPKVRVSLGANSASYRVLEADDGKAVLQRLTAPFSIVLDGGRFHRLIR